MMTVGGGKLDRWPDGTARRLDKKAKAVSGPCGNENR
jgi:hypothetical protein